MLKYKYISIATAFMVKKIKIKLREWNFLRGRNTSRWISYRGSIWYAAYTHLCNYRRKK